MWLFPSARPVVPPLPRTVLAPQQAIAAVGRAELRRSPSDPFLSLPPTEHVWGDPYAPAALPCPRKPSQAGLLAAPAATPALVGQLLLDHQITDLEERLKTAMGPWALYGLRYATLVGLAAATLIKIAIAITPITTPLVPLVGLAIFMGVLVAGIVLGAIIQAIARSRFRNSGQNPQLFLKELQYYETQLAQKASLTGTEIRSLRRLQILRADVEGGFRHSLWSIFYGITGFDPQLRTMMRGARWDAPQMA